MRRLVITSADIVERKYYYCGTEWDDVKRTLREELGIGRLDPSVR